MFWSVFCAAFMHNKRIIIIIIKQYKADKNSCIIISQKQNVLNNLQRWWNSHGQQMATKWIVCSDNQGVIWNAGWCPSHSLWWIVIRDCSTRLIRSIHLIGLSSNLTFSNKQNTNNNQQNIPYHRFNGCVLGRPGLASSLAFLFHLFWKKTFANKPKTVE